MADQRQPFRFRLPWLSAATPPRPAAEPQPPRPTAQPRIPSQAATTAQRPPFRPAGIAPAQPPPSQVQPPPRPEPQTARPLPAAIDTQTTSPPESPSPATTETRTASVPPSPTRATNGSRVTSQPSSPTRATTQTRPPSQTQSPTRSAEQSKAASATPSPSRMASQPSQAKSPSRPQPQPVDRAFSQPTSPTRTTPEKPTQAVAQPPSPSKKLEPTTQDTSQPQTISSELPSSSSKEEPKPEAYLSVSQQPEPKTQPASEASSKHQIESPVETILQNDDKAAQTTEAPTPGTLIAPNSRAAPKQQAIPQTKAEEKLEETAERKKAVEKSQEKKKTITTSASDGKVIRTVDATQPKDRRKYDELLHKQSLSNGERAPLQKEIKEDISKLVQTVATGQSKQPMDDKPISVITLAGENKGASVHIGAQAEKKAGTVHIRRGYKTNPDDSPDSTPDAQGRSKGKHRDPKTKEEMATKAYVNSNTQAINNSIMFGSSVNERDPGVQLNFSSNFAEPSRCKPEPLETSKAEVNVTPAEKLTYAPTVRRRCLRGLFMESSESEPDNPDKPRRHGCRYNCCAKKRDQEIGIL